MHRKIINYLVRTSSWHLCILAKVQGHSEELHSPLLWVLYNNYGYFWTRAMFFPTKNALWFFIHMIKSEKIQSERAKRARTLISAEFCDTTIFTALEESGEAKLRVNHPFLSNSNFRKGKVGTSRCHWYCISQVGEKRWTKGRVYQQHREKCARYHKREARENAKYLAADNTINDMDPKKQSKYFFAGSTKLLLGKTEGAQNAKWLMRIFFALAALKILAIFALKTANQIKTTHQQNLMYNLLKRNLCFLKLVAYKINIRKVLKTIFHWFSCLH